MELINMGLEFLHSVFFALLLFPEKFIIGIKALSLIQVFFVIFVAILVSIVFYEILQLQKRTHKRKIIALELENNMLQEEINKLS